MPMRKAPDSSQRPSEILRQLPVGRFADDNEQPDLRSNYRFFLIRPLIDAFVSGYREPAIPADFRQPFFVRSVMPEEIGMSSHLKTGSRQNLREGTTKVPIREKYHTQAALS